MRDAMKEILIVDDSMANLDAISELLSGLYRVFSAGSGAAALKILENQHPDLILLDADMPEMSGVDLIKIIKENKTLSGIPVIFLTELNDAVSEARVFESGAVDYIHKPVNGVVMLERIKLHLELEAYRSELEDLVKIRTARVSLLQKITIDLLASVNEFRDHHTGSHVKRSTRYVCAIMDNLPQDPRYYISDEDYDNIKDSAPLHDIGKISVPDSILLKPARLTYDEFEIMKTHVTSGTELLRNAIAEFDGPSYLDMALEIVLTHHEKWDGSGYPNNLSGENIPLCGRIMAIADVYDALTSQRPYKPVMPHEEAMAVITESRGTHFDPVLVDTFVRIQDDIFNISEHYKAEREHAF